MSIINYLIAVVVILLLVIFIYLIIQNRTSEIIYTKVLPAIAIGLISGFFALYFSLQSYSLSGVTITALISNSKSMTPLEADHENYWKYYGGKLFAPRMYVNPYKGQELWDYHFDIICNEIICTLFDTFQAFSNQPDSIIYSTGYYPRNLELKKELINWESYLEFFEEDSSLHFSLSQIEKGEDIKCMAIPKGTKISYSNTKFIRTIKLKNSKLDFEISIAKSSGKQGLDDWKWILDLSDEEKEEYWISFFPISYSINGSKITNGHPDMLILENWSNSIIDRIDKEYNYDLQLQNATEYFRNFGEKLRKN